MGGKSTWVFVCGVCMFHAWVSSEYYGFLPQSKKHACEVDTKVPQGVGVCVPYDRLFMVYLCMIHIELVLAPTTRVPLMLKSVKMDR